MMPCTYPALQDTMKYQGHILYLTSTHHMMVPCTYPALQDTMKYQGHILCLTSTHHMMAHDGTLYISYTTGYNEISGTYPVLN